MLVLAAMPRMSQLDAAVHQDVSSVASTPGQPFMPTMRLTMAKTGLAIACQAKLVLQGLPCAAFALFNVGHQSGEGDLWSVAGLFGFSLSIPVQDAKLVCFPQRASDPIAEPGSRMLLCVGGS